MRCLFPDIHRTLVSHVARMMKVLGHDLLLPSWKPTNLPPPPVSSFCYDYSRTTKLAQEMYGDNVFCVTKEECLDIKPDFLWISNFESQFEILKEIAPHLPDAKIGFYSGNSYWNGWFDHSKYHNLIYTDTTSQEIARIHNLKNAHLWRPFIHSEEPFKPSIQDPVQITSFINSYSKNFNQEFVFFNKLKEISPKIQLENVEEKNPEEVREKQLACTAGISVKKLEGFGFSNIELMSAGRPVLLHRTCCQGKSLLSWSKHLQTCLYFESGADYKEIIDFMLETPENILSLQENCYKRIRQIINSDEQIEVLKKFLENLV